MRPTQRQLWSIGGGAAIALLMAQPAWADLVQVVGVGIQRGGGEAEIVLDLVGSDDPPEVLTYEEGNRLIADIPESQLQVNGNSRGFSTRHPIPGITEVKLVPTSDNSVQLVIIGERQLPIGQLRRHTAQQIIIAFSPAPPPQPLSTTLEIPDYPEPLGPTAPVQQTFQLNQAIASQVVTTLVQQGATTPDHDPSPESEILPLRDLHVTADNQANIVSLMGEASQVYAAVSLIKRRDVRLPLIKVDVTILTVNIQQLGRIGCLTHGHLGTPPFNRIAIDLSHPELSRPDWLDSKFVCGYRDFGDFIALLQVALESQNAKILSDITLLAQAGQTATVPLTQAVLEEFLNPESELDVSNALINIADEETVGLSVAIKPDFKAKNAGLPSLGG